MVMDALGCPPGPSHLHEEVWDHCSWGGVSEGHQGRMEKETCRGLGNLSRPLPLVSEKAPSFTAGMKRIATATSCGVR